MSAALQLLALAALFGPPQTPHLKNYAGWVDGIAVSPAGDRIVTADDDHKLLVWDTKTGQLAGTLDNAFGKGGTKPLRLYHFAFLDDRTLVGGGGEFGGKARLEVWDTTTGKVTQTLCGHETRIWSIAVHPEGKLLATVDSYGLAIHLWKIERPDDEPARLTRWQTITPKSLEDSPDKPPGFLWSRERFHGAHFLGKDALVISGENKLIFWRMSLKKIAGHIVLPNDCRPVCLTSNGSRFAVANGEGGLLICKAKDKSVETAVVRTEKYCADVLMVGDHALMYVCRSKATLMPTETGPTLRIGGENVNAVAVNDVGDVIAIGRERGVSVLTLTLSDDKKPSTKADKETGK